jgi:hypothetical protein
MRKHPRDRYRKPQCSKWFPSAPPAQTHFEHTISGLLTKRADLFNEAERLRDRLAEINNRLKKWLATSKHTRVGMGLGVFAYLIPGNYGTIARQAGSRHAYPENIVTRR